jgi:hypothetical protein
MITNLWNGSSKEDWHAAVQDSCLLDLCMFGSWLVEGGLAEDFETVEIGQQAMALWCNTVKAAIRGGKKGALQADAVEVRARARAKRAQRKASATENALSV